MATVTADATTALSSENGVGGSKVDSQPADPHRDRAAAQARAAWAKGATYSKKAAQPCCETKEGAQSDAAAPHLLTSWGLVGVLAVQSGVDRRY